MGGFGGGGLPVCCIHINLIEKYTFGLSLILSGYSSQHFVYTVMNTVRRLTEKSCSSGRPQLVRRFCRPSTGVRTRSGTHRSPPASDGLLAEARSGSLLASPSLAVYLVIQTHTLILTISYSQCRNRYVYNRNLRQLDRHTNR